MRKKVLPLYHVSLFLQTLWDPLGLLRVEGELRNNPNHLADTSTKAILVIYAKKKNNS